MKKFLLVLVFFIAVTANKSLAGTTYTWTGLGLTTNWTTAANWSPSSGYPGSGGSTTDVAVINLSLLSVTLTSSVTISQLKTTTYGITNVTVNLSGSSTALTISNGISTAQPSIASTVITFSGSGSATISGTSTFAYNGSMAVSSGTMVTFAANSVLDFTSNQGSLTNAGTLQFLSGSNFKVGYGSSLSNSGTVTLSGATFTLSGSPCSISNTGTFNATNSIFTLSGSTIPITNSGVMTTDNCTFTSSNTGCSFTNSSNYYDHGSTITLTGQNNTFKNSTSTSVMQLIGSTITFSGGNNGHSITNAGTLTADSSATINLGTYTAKLSNSGTVYAGISNSSCIINLSAQGSNISNSGTFYVGSTSGITVSGYQAAISSTAFFIFQSDQYGSGWLGSLPSSSVGLITGGYYIERYISGGSAAYRGYRLLSSPIYFSTISSNNVYSLNYIKASALTTGSGGTTGGFDKAGNPSIYLYRENIAFSNTTYISGNFRGIASIASAPSYTMDSDGGPYNIPVGNGFLFWFRGDRTTNLANKYTPGTSAESVTMTAYGTLNQGQITVHDWYTPSSSNLGYSTTSGNTSVRGDNLVGNPYPSSIDWENFQTTTTTTGIYGSNVGNTIYELNQTNQNYGAYIKGGGGIGTNNATNIIASGQGFFVVATSSSAKLIFNESAKSTSQVTGSGLLMSTSANLVSSNPYLRLKLGRDTVNMDDMLIRFNSLAQQNYSDAEDAPYKAGFGKGSLASMSADKVVLAINTMPLPKNNVSIPIVVNAMNDGVYHIDMSELNQVPRLYDIWLMDAYKKDSLDIRDNKTYAFNIYKKDSTSFGANRFSLVIRQNPGYAYHLLSFAATKIASSQRQVRVNWTVENEQNYTNFAVERSTDGGKTFNIIGSTTGTGQGTYGFTDKAPASQNLYRLQSQDINSNITYSYVVPIAYSDLSNNIAPGNITIYPNPVASTINLTIAGSPLLSANYRILITNSSGQVVKQASSSSLTWQGNAGDLQAGTYVLRVLNAKDLSEIGSTKFVKL
jgi:hypothetical protein